MRRVRYCCMFSLSILKKIISGLKHGSLSRVTVGHIWIHHVVTKVVTKGCTLVYKTSLIE